MIGERLGPYEILAPIGAGGMGEVYRAHDSKLHRDVAVKVLPEVFAADVERMARFEREARVLASLNHPNIASIYGLEESGSARALVMELIQGRTLAERIAAGPIQIGDALSIARQIGEAMACAHERGIIHRDLKPANIMITENGLVKVLDFGLAKLAEKTEDAGGETASLPLTEAGAVVGTSGYMSPEQLRGLPIDHRTDLFSFGVVLYEMITGARAFPGSSPMAIADAILHDQLPDFGDSPAPAKLKAMIRKLLEKDPANRCSSTAEVIQELKALEISLAPVRPARLSRKAWIAIGTAVLLAGFLAVWLWRGASRERWALQTAAPEITRLIDSGEYVKAAVLTREAFAALPKDPTLEKLWIKATGEASIASVPADAVVSIRPYGGDPNAWETLGKTPFEKMRLPRDAYVWRIAKPGFASVFFIYEFGDPPIPGYASDPNVNLEASLVNRPSIKMELKLRPEASVRPEMVVVPGGSIRLGYPLNQAPAAVVDDFLIDRHEVSNEEYKKFVDAGGYRKREFWKQAFVRDGRNVLWEDAVALFLDATGRPGPATWEVGDYPKGHGKYPVAGVSWYEVAAYAEFAGKSLPTAYHWARASQSLFNTSLIASGSNFGSEGTQPVGSERALSGFGTTDMAGNVKEWCLNESKDGKRLILGGGFGEPIYMFNNTDTQSPWERQANFGFRCVKLDSPPAPAAATHLEEVTIRDYWKEKPVPDEVFKAYTALYAYDKGDLNARVEETASMDISSCETVTFDAAYDGDRVTVYIFLPKNGSPPFQIVVYYPGLLAFFDNKLDLSSVEETRGFLLQSGRALIFPIYKGMYERQDDFKPITSPPARHRDQVIKWAKDLSRTLDYLETRKDIDSTKVAYFGDSMGAMEGALLPAIEKRIKAAILSSGGFQLMLLLRPEADPFNFAPHVTIPVLMLNGRYDNAFFPLESSQRPLFDLLGTPARDKKQVIYEGGHGAFPRPDAVRECLDWLDRYLGPVRR
jgi:formylglycine-generating enzyme required for sulfatase activity/dienelactone hydrolase